MEIPHRGKPRQNVFGARDEIPPPLPPPRQRSDTLTNLESANSAHNGGVKWSRICTPPPLAYGDLLGRRDYFDEQTVSPNSGDNFSPGRSNDAVQTAIPATTVNRGHDKAYGLEDQAPLMDSLGFRRSTSTVPQPTQSGFQSTTPRKFQSTANSYDRALLHKISGRRPAVHTPSTTSSTQDTEVYHPPRPLSPPRGPRRDELYRYLLSSSEPPYAGPPNLYRTNPSPYPDWDTLPSSLVRQDTDDPYPIQTSATGADMTHSESRFNLPSKPQRLSPLNPSSVPARSTDYGSHPSPGGVERGTKSLHDDFLGDLVGLERRESSSSLGLDTPHSSYLNSKPTTFEPFESAPEAGIKDDYSIHLTSPIKTRKLTDRQRSSEQVGVYTCECCPQKPKKFETQEELDTHEQEMRFQCAYCHQRFDNKMQAERHVNALHLRRHSWSCAFISGYAQAFYNSSTNPNHADTCGYCGEEYPRSDFGLGAGAVATDQDWKVRISHLQEAHKFKECNQDKKFFRADHFRQHLKHSHAGRYGTWSNLIENACMKRDSSHELPDWPQQPKPPVLGDIFESKDENAEVPWVAQEIVHGGSTGALLSTSGSPFQPFYDKTKANKLVDEFPEIPRFPEENELTSDIKTLAKIASSRSDASEEFSNGADIHGLDPRSHELFDKSQQLMDNTDVATCLSKDSGYSSMVSKAQKSTLVHDHEESDSMKWVSGSVISVQSLATIDTMSSVNPTAVGGAAEELAEMLIKDELISELIMDGYKRFTPDRFERNLRRMLKKFALSLRREAKNDLEKSAIRVVNNYRAYIIILIKRRLGLAQDPQTNSFGELQKQKQSQLALERFLEVLPGAEHVGVEDRVEDNESGSDSDSDLSNPEQPNLPTLEKVKLYLLSSTAFLELKEQLTAFVRPTWDMSYWRNQNLQLAVLDARYGVLDVREEILIAKDRDVDPKLSQHQNFPQLGSSSNQDIQWNTAKWNAAVEIPQKPEPKETLQNDDLRNVLRPDTKLKSINQTSAEGYSIIDSFPEKTEQERKLPKILQEKFHLDGLAPKRGWLDKALLSLHPLLSMTQQCESRQLLKLRNWWVRSRRESVGRNYTRIEWTCECGHDLFADFKNISPELIRKYASILKRTPSETSPNTTTPPQSNTPSSLLPAHLRHSNSSNLPVQNTHILNNLSPASTLQSLSGAALAETIDNSVDLSFLELCVNTGPHLKSLAEIDTAHISTDGALFKSLRRQYLSLRGFRARFWLLKPAAVSFVRFSLENRHRVGILQKPLALPPKSEVDAKKWVYDPCPLEGDPPIAEDLFLHYLQCSESSSNLFWMLRFPRKLGTSLLKPNASANFGWGIHIDEGPDYAALFKANFIVLSLSGLAAWLWSFFKHDFQGAFGFACWIIAVLNSLLMAYMFKWRQE